MVTFHMFECSAFMLQFTVNFAQINTYARAFSNIRNSFPLMGLDIYSDIKYFIGYKLHTHTKDVTYYLFTI